MTIDLPANRTDSLPERIQYSQALAVSNLLPTQYRGKPENVLYAIEFGRSLGIEPIAAITGVHIIEGKPSASSGLISALVRRAGHRLRVWVERDANGTLLAAIATIIRKDDPDFEFRSTWTMARATSAGLTNKSVWKNYPEAMLKARAVSEVAREACEEELSGVGYTPEELGAEVNSDGSVVVTTAPARANQPGQTIRDAVAQPVSEVASTAAPEPVAEAERMISGPQQKKLGALMREHNITDRDTALAFVADVIGRPVTSRNELTMAEAGKVIDTLESAPPPTVPDDEVVDGDIVDDTPDQYSEAS
ncbi:RecT family protein [Streptosporangium canum]|uniref:RecT family protein n=1 Tax=Streptosporangium canum TaxID=324952 RepID=A0A1I4DCZ9_9ACTN|nr:recombinase RecT [Streptosporangium canum]SFK91694.1 RecT family protein [Streptosporangium canum]